MTDYNLISENPESTVVALYERPLIVAEGYQSENELERSFISQLSRQGYEYFNIHHSDELEANLRLQIEKLNDVKFTDNEVPLHFTIPAGMAPVDGEDWYGYYYLGSQYGWIW